jgi:hypothetical protein
MDDRTNTREVTRRITELLDELVDLIKPTGFCGQCEEQHDCPPGPWMITGWVMAIDIAAESVDDDQDAEVETWTTTYKSKNLPNTQAFGLATRIASSNT